MFALWGPLHPAYISAYIIAFASYILAISNYVLSFPPKSKFQQRGGIYRPGLDHFNTTDKPSSKCAAADQTFLRPIKQQRTNSQQHNSSHRGFI